MSSSTPSPAPSPGNPSTIPTVSKLTLITFPTNRTIYSGSSPRFGSFTIPLRLSVFTRYWSITHSSADRLPSRYANASAGIPLQRQKTVVAQLRSVFGEPHLLHPPVERHLRRLDLFKRVLRLLLITHVDLRQARARRREAAKVGREGDARQFTLEVGLVTFTVDRVVQQAVDVVKDIPLTNRPVTVLRPGTAPAPSR